MGHFVLHAQILRRTFSWSFSTGETVVGIERPKRSRHLTGARLVSMKLARVARGYEMPFWSMGIQGESDNLALGHGVLRGSTEAPISGD